ncbi:unnamed protein product [Candidula unifasciata]|uniref:Uncharacterized protein n=1 Tax=Candidula unifasciata TaxID=100452 RepID=A0A8S3YW73_9EUPU|nr:unnamed protein product [Candidula unifasciata]
MHQEVKYDEHQEARNWHLTSTGVGHHYRPGYFFPDSEFKTLLRDPLPPKLAAEDEVTKDKPFLTTKEYFHDRKFPGLLYSNSLHKKAPGHWNVDYIKDLAEKLGQRGGRRPLTMGNQQSEMKDQYQAKPPEVREKYNFEDVYSPLNFTLQEHFKAEAPSIQNPKIRQRPFLLKNKGVLNRLDPYLSVTHRDYPLFSPSELSAYAKKDVPANMGQGLQCKSLPMRDEVVFHDATTIPRLPKANVPVPHGGLKTLYTDSYQAPSHVNMKENYYCPVDTPFRLPDPGSKSVYTAPKMYNTEYQNIGSRKPVTVSK